MVERFHYRHVRDFLDDMPNGAELTGLFAYLQQDDEARANWGAYSVAKAFNGDGKTRKRKTEDEDEEVIDTTKPEFVEQFKGFNHMKPIQAVTRPQQSTTEIMLG